MSADRCVCCGHVLRGDRWRVEGIGEICDECFVRGEAETLAEKLKRAGELQITRRRVA